MCFDINGEIFWKFDETRSTLNLIQSTPYIAPPSILPPLDTFLNEFVLPARTDSPNPIFFDSQQDGIYFIQM